MQKVSRIVLEAKQCSFIVIVKYENRSCKTDIDKSIQSDSEIEFTIPRQTVEANAKYLCLPQ